jgi:hypothetical protein
MTPMRLGPAHDGGYILLAEPCSMATEFYSFGVGNDVGFELDYVSRFPLNTVHLFDPTIDHLPQEHRNFRFQKRGIGMGNDPLTAVVPDAILKMDVEGHEWQAFATMPRSTLKTFSQMVIEFHILHVEPRAGLTPYFHGLYASFTDTVNVGVFEAYRDVMRKISEFFYCYHLHANNSLPLVTVDGVRFPPLLEMSFIRHDLASQMQPTTKTFPVPGLDAPNKTDRSDPDAYYPFRRFHAEPKIKAA